MLSEDFDGGQRVTFSTHQAIAPLVSGLLITLLVRRTAWPRKRGRTSGRL